MSKLNQVRTVNMPTMNTRALMRPDTVNEEARSVEFSFTTGERGLRQPFWDDPYYEELEISNNAIRSERLDKGLSVIDSHRVYDGIDGVHGITSDWRIDGGALVGTVTFADDEDSDKVFRKVVAGILRHVSLGYTIHRMQLVEEVEGVPVYRAIDWSPTELSIVPVSFETTNGVRSIERNQLNECIIEDDRMPIEDVAPVPTVAPVAAPVARSLALSESDIRSNLTGFLEAAKQAGFETEHATRAFTNGTTVGDYRTLLLKELGQRSNANAPGTPMVDDGRTDQVQAKREDLATAIASRLNGDTKDLSDNARAFAQMPMMEAMRHYMISNGQRDVMGMSGLHFAGRALQTTSDLPLILENVMNKELLVAYQESMRTFTNFARRTTVNDFRAKNTYKMGDAPDLLPLGEGGEYKYGKFSESKESYRLSTYARKLGFTRQMMMNDDMGALSRFPQMFGGAASRLESDIVWGLILNYDFIRNKVANHKLFNNKALYHDDHKNLLAGATSAFSQDGLSLLRKLGRDQLTLDGKFMNVVYNMIAVGSTLETKAEQILTGITTPASTSSVNVFKDKFDIIIEPRIEAVSGGATAYYAFSRAVQAIEYAYLAGNEGIHTEVVESSDIDGTTILARHDFGAGFEDHRGTAKATGAA